MNKATELKRIIKAKEDIKNALNKLNTNVLDDDKIDVYHKYIDRLNMNSIFNVEECDKKFIDYCSQSIINIKKKGRYDVFFRGIRLNEVPEIRGRDSIESCVSLFGGQPFVNVGDFEVENAKNVQDIFCMCRNLKSINKLDVSAATNTRGLFYKCQNLEVLNELDVYSSTYSPYAFSSCYKLRVANIKNLKTSIDLSDSVNLGIESLQYMLDNAQQVQGETISLHSNLAGKVPREMIQGFRAKGFNLTF